MEQLHTKLDGRIHITTVKEKGNILQLKYFCIVNSAFVYKRTDLVIGISSSC